MEGKEVREGGGGVGDEGNGKERIGKGCAMVPGEGRPERGVYGSQKGCTMIRAQIFFWR